MMKHFGLIAFFVLVCGWRSAAQTIMKPDRIAIENACNPNAIFIAGVEPATPKESIDSIESRLNREVTFAREHPKLKRQCAIHCIVDCAGGTSTYYMAMHSGDDKLDIRLINFFKSVHDWNVARLKGKPVDSWYMWHVQIKKGYIQLETPRYKERKSKAG